MHFEWISLALQAITVLAVAFAAFQLMFHSRQMHRDLEMIYVQRYWDLMDQRTPDFISTEEPQADDHTVIYKYLQLCEDELDLRQIARVTDSTWEFWGPSMHSQLTSAAYRKAFEETSPYRFPQVKRLVASGPAHDPLQRNRFWRRFRGL